jgi:ketosteroid isomerase-like protein
MTSSKLQTIESIYQAFGRGDVAAVVNAFVPDGQISFNVATPAAPWQASVRGHAELPRFFAKLAEHVEFLRFEPSELIEGPTSVAARIQMKFVVKSTGRIVEQSQVHWWTFDGPKVRAIVHFEDTAQVAAAVA